LSLIKKIRQLFGGRPGPENLLMDTVDSRHTGLVDSVKNGWFLQQSDELLVTYTDINPAAVDELRTRFETGGFSPSTEGIVSNSDPLPLASDSYDKIVCLEVLEHTINPQRCMNELFRVGKPGAQYLLSVPGELGENIQKSYAPKLYFDVPNHLHVFSKSDFESLVEASGLLVKQYDTSGFYWFMWMSLYWIEQKQNGVELTGAALDKVEPPYSALLQKWSMLWHEVLKNPHSKAMRRHLDDLLPKSQIIIATKPEA
jgi:SAM-dependent methyltransferase